MRALVARSAVTAAALVVGVLTASTAQADVIAPTAAPVPSTGGVPQVAGLVVTGRASETAIESATEDALDGTTTVDDIERVTGDQRVVTFDDTVTGDLAERVAAELDARPDVISAEPDYIRTIADASPVTVNDQFFPQQTHLWDTTRSGGGFSTKATAFWKRTMGSPSVRVAVLDTGKTAHPDLVWAAGRDVVDNDGDPTDPGSLLGSAGDFHGTHVAGIVAARANNGIGVAGVAPGVTLVPVRVLDGNGAGTDADIAAGIRWATSAGVQVINMSLGGAGACTSVLSSAIQAARSRGIVVVAAAGNEARDAAGYAPASCPGVIAVGATDAAGRRASFSNVGATVDVSAPGVDVLSTGRSGRTYGYVRQSGTSMASPAVAGAAALFLSAGLNRAQTEAVLPWKVVPARSSGTAGIISLSGYRGIPTRVSMRVTSKVSKGGRAAVRVRLLSPTGLGPAGRIRVFDGKRIVRRATVWAARDGTIKVKTPRLHRKGAHRIKVVFLGDGVYLQSRSVTRTVTVR